MKTNMILLAVVAMSATFPTLGAVLAAPEIENMNLVRDANTHLVTISYDLSDDAIVTAQVFTNGVALPQCAYGNMGGKVHRVVTQGTGHQIWWNPPTREMDALVAAGSAEVKLSAWAKDDPPDYLAIDLLATNCWRFYVTAEDVPLGVTNRLYKNSKLLMRKIYAKDITWPAGISSDRMNATETYSGTNLLHRPHYVTLTYNYYIGVYEVTYSQYRNAASWSYAGNTYAYTEEKDIIPADQPQAIYWPTLRLKVEDMRGHTPTSAYWPTHGHAVPAESGVGKFRRRTGLDLDLTTEAEWEYACRAGESMALYTGEKLNLANFSKIGWAADNWQNDPACPSNQLHEVGLLRPNKWGLYDMLGNGFEVCLDVMSDKSTDPYQIDPYKGEDVVDPVGPTAEQGAAAQQEGGTYVDKNGKTQYTWPNYVTATGRRARRGGSVFSSTSSSPTAPMNHTSCRTDSRANISYSGNTDYPSNAYRLALPAVIP